MLRDEIIEMARQAGFSLEWQGYGYSCLSEDIINFAKLVAAKERESCANVCETAEILIDIDVWHGSTKKEMTEHTALALAKAIRARGEA